MAHFSAPRTVRLRPVFEGIATLPEELEASDITLDSRSAVAGGAFLACAGIKSHGLQHLDQAIAAGVRTVFWEPRPGLAEPRLPQQVFGLAVPELSRHLGTLAHRFFDTPSAHVRIAGITGTNGKTTSAWLLAQALEAVGVRAGYMGTLGCGSLGNGSQEISLSKVPTHTTPDCITVHRRISALRAQGVRALAMEVSSHALAQDRIAGVRFDTAVFTNLSRDHLDYHQSMEAYGEAKARLFALPGLAHRVLNIQDPFGRRIAASVPAGATLTLVSARALSARRAEENFVCAREATASTAGLQIQVESSWGAGLVRSRLIGDFNVENVLTVLAILLVWDVQLPQALAAVGAGTAAPGRMETFSAAGRPLAVVDYAHSPDALAKVLRALRRHCTGKLWCVFGCGGDRDPGKRLGMGALAAQLADEIVLTDDNPRTEDPERIIRDILAGVPPHAKVRVIRDRAEAIAAALQAAQAPDAVLIAGKGHEEYQVYGTEVRPFSDRSQVQRLQGGGG